MNRSNKEISAQRIANAYFTVYCPTFRLSFKSVLSLFDKDPSSHGEFLWSVGGWCGYPDWCQVIASGRFHITVGRISHFELQFSVLKALATWAFHEMIIWLISRRLSTYIYTPSDWLGSVQASLPTLTTLTKPQVLTALCQNLCTDSPYDSWAFTTISGTLMLEPSSFL